MTQNISKGTIEMTGIEEGGPVDPSDVLYRFLELSNRLNAPFSTHLERRFNITINEFRLLMMIGRLGISASHELADRTGVNIMSVSRAVSALEKHGRITVARDPRNRRRKTLKLTEEGRLLYEAMRPSSVRVAQYMLSALRLDEILAFDRFIATAIDTLAAKDGNGESMFLASTRPDDADTCKA